MSNNELNSEFATTRNARSVTNQTMDELKMMLTRREREKQAEIDSHRKRTDDLHYEIQRLSDHHNARLTDMNFAIASLKINIQNLERQDELMTSANTKGVAAPDMAKEMQKEHPNAVVEVKK